MERTFPFTAWRLLPGFTPAKVVLVKQYDGYGGKRLVSDKHKYYKESDIFDSPKAAIDEGFARLSAQEAHIDKLRAGIDKKHAALIKAEKALDGGK